MVEVEGVLVAQDAPCDPRQLVGQGRCQLVAMKPWSCIEQPCSEAEAFPIVRAHQDDVCGLDEQGSKIEVPLESKRYTLSAEPFRRSDVELNGATLNVDDAGDLPAIEGAATTAGSVSFAPGTITFLAIERSGNSACRGS